MKQIKRIFLVGAFREDKDIYTYALSFRDIFSTFCSELKTFNYKSFYKKLIKKFLGNYFYNRISNYLLILSAKKFKPDFIFIIKGDFIFPNTVLKLKQISNPIIVNFYTDNPFTFWNGNSNANILKSLPLFDRVFIWSYMLIQPLLSSGSNKVCYLPFCYDEKIFFCNKNNYEKKYELCFVGTWSLERAEILESLLKLKPDLNLVIFGNNWNENLSIDSKLKKAVHGNAIYGSMLVQLFCDSKIVLNFIRPQNMTSHNMRTMEVLATGAFLLTQRTIEQSEILFKEDLHLACFSDLDELILKIDFYLKNQTLREKIAAFGAVEVKKYRLTTYLKNLISAINEDKCLKDCNQYAIPTGLYKKQYTSAKDSNSYNLSI